MSITRLTWTTALLALVTVAAAGASAWALPLNLGGLGRQADGPARLEIRLAETAPAAGLIVATAPGSDQFVYLHPTSLATGADVTSVRVVEPSGGLYGVSLTFSDAAAARLASGTAAHIGRPMAIVLDGNVISSATVRGPVSNNAVITGVTADSARQLADRLAPVAGTPDATRGPVSNNAAITGATADSARPPANRLAPAAGTPDATRGPVSDNAAITGATADSARPPANRLAPAAGTPDATRGPVSNNAAITGATDDSSRQLADRQAPVAAPDVVRVGGTLPTLLKKVDPQYTAAAMRAKITGMVVLEAVVLADGTVGKVTVIRSLDSTYGLDQEAVAAASQWKFRPGTKDGKPIAVAVQIELTFMWRDP